MKILVVSDTHGRNKNLQLVISRVKPIDMLIHLGDIEDDFETIEKLAGCETHIVAGNNDFFCDLPREKNIQIENFSVFLTHGHKYGVSYNPENLLDKSFADIIMFGHTHVPYIKKFEERYLINPGSLSYPRQEGKIPTYIILETRENTGIHVELKNLF